MIDIKKDCEDGCIGFVAVGINDSNLKINIENVTIENTERVFNVNFNRLYFKNLKNKDKIKLKFQTDLKVKAAIATEN